MQPRPLEDRLAPVMFTLSALFLLLIGIILHRHRNFDVTDAELRAELAILAALWPLFLADALLRFARRGPHRRALPAAGELLAVGLLPPLRLGLRSVGPAREFWFPGLGWRPVGKGLRKELERIFSVPMIVIALLVLPLLAVEYGWPEQVQQRAGLALFLEVGGGVIWFAFAFELIILAAVAEKKLPFLLEHWVSVAIVVLPLVQFLPLVRALRLSRVMRLEQLTRWGRVYRMRGTLARAWRAFLLLELVQRLTGATPQRRLQRVEELMAAREEELAELRREADALRRLIAARQAADAAAATAPAISPAAPAAAPDNGAAQPETSVP